MRSFQLGSQARPLALILSILAASCGGDDGETTTTPEDTGTETEIDSGTIDAGGEDSTVDSTVDDTAIADSASADSADSSSADSASADSTTTDSAATDSGAGDTATTGDAADSGAGDTATTSDAADAISCDDLNPCTADSIGDGGTCVHTPLTGTACDDGNACNGTADLCVAGVCKGQPKTLREDFSAALDSAKWTTNTSKGTVTVSGGRATITDRGYLTSANEYDPTKGPVRVTAEWTFTSSDDFLRITTRGNGTPGGVYGEIDSGAGCAIAADGGLSLGKFTGSTYTSTATSSTKLTYTVGNPIIIEQFDDGTTITCTARVENTNQRITISGDPGFTATKNFVSFYNRENTGTSHVGYLDNVTIERGVTSRPYTQWQFEETSGDKVLDWAAISDGSIGTATNHAAGVLGTNITTVGNANSWADFGTSLGGLGTGNFSISFWVKAPKPSSTKDFLGNRDSSSGAQYFGTRVGTDGRIGIEMYGAGGAGGGSLPVSTPILDDTWHHVVLERNGTTLAAFVDGVAAGTSTATVTNVNSTKTFIYGKSPFVDGYTNYFAGSIDDLRLYDRAISTCEVKNVYGN